MPNRCSNTVSITGPIDELSKIKKLLRKKWFFNSFHPLPKALKGGNAPTTKKDNESEEQFRIRIDRLIEKYGATNRYDWQVINRGTKRDVASKDIYKQINDREIYLQFDTARSPPEHAFTKLAELYPKLKIFMEYFELGMCFSGVIDWKDGEYVGQSNRDDPYFGQGKECVKCHSISDGNNPDDRQDEARTICNWCE